MALEPIRVPRDFASPYRTTRIYVQDGRAFYGIRVPLPVRIDGDEEEHAIQLGQEGCLDFVADALLRDRALWPVIGDLNLLADVADEVRPGLKLRIPKIENVNAALLAAGQRAREVGS